MKNSSPSHVFDQAVKPLVNMTKQSSTETIRGENGQKLVKMMKTNKSNVHPNHVNAAKLGVLLLHVLDQVHHPEN